MQLWTFFPTTLTYLWKKKNNPSCPLCHEKQTLLRILNNCRVARDARRYNLGHDSVLSAITDVVQHSIPPTSTMTADIGDTYNTLSHHHHRPDLVWWDEAHKAFVLANLTVCFETNFSPEEVSKVHSSSGAGPG